MPDCPSPPATELIELRHARLCAARLADIPMIGRLAELAREDREQNARYRIERSDIVNFKWVNTTVCNDLPYHEAVILRDESNAKMVAEFPKMSSWTRPLHLIVMEERTCMVEMPTGYGQTVEKSKVSGARNAMAPNGKRMETENA